MVYTLEDYRAYYELRRSVDPEPKVEELYNE